MWDQNPFADSHLDDFRRSMTLREIPQNPRHIRVSRRGLSSLAETVVAEHLGAIGLGTAPLPPPLPAGHSLSQGASAGRAAETLKPPLMTSGVCTERQTMPSAASAP